MAGRNSASTPGRAPRARGGVGVAVLIFLIARGANPAGPTPRLVNFPGGQTTIDMQLGMDHIVVQKSDGILICESWCEAGTFDEYFTLFTKFKAAVVAGDRAAMLRLIDNPLRVNRPPRKQPAFYNDAPSLAKSFATVFTSKVRQKILRAEPAVVFCRHGQAMLGDGVVWARSTGITVVNQ